MNKVKYKLNREWLNELLKHKTNSNVYFSLSDNDIRILLTYIDVLQSKIDKANEILNKLEMQPAYLDCKYYELEGFKELKEVLKEVENVENN